MALKDLTPQLRTRLSRVERAVGWFVLLALALLAVGFGYYVYTTAQRKGWFQRKITYETCVSSAAGLKVGDPVKLLGFEVGEITAVIPNDPYAYYNITLQFRVKVNQYNYQGYIWSDSRVKVNAGDLLGNRYLEITKGVGGAPTILESTNNEVLAVLRDNFIQQLQKERFMARRRAEWETAQGEGRRPQSDAALLATVNSELNTEARANPKTFYTNDFLNNIYFLEPLESPAVSERLDRLVTQVENALPGILALTNQIANVLANTVDATSNLNTTAVTVQPAVENLVALTSQLRGPGALGEWMLGTNGAAGVDALVARLHTTTANVDTNLTALVENLGRSLNNIAAITSNLNAQVQSNTNMLGEISRAVIHADELVQGLKRHWLLRSAFRSKTNAPPPATSPQLPPRAREAFHGPPVPPR
jgi:ABC-type transporter Mla subunit MlaD